MSLGEGRLWQIIIKPCQMLMQSYPDGGWDEMNTERSEVLIEMSVTYAPPSRMPLGV